MNCVLLVVNDGCFQKTLKIQPRISWKVKIITQIHSCLNVMHQLFLLVKATLATVSEGWDGEGVCCCEVLTLPQAHLQADGPFLFWNREPWTNQGPKGSGVGAPSWVPGYKLRMTILNYSCDLIQQILLNALCNWVGSGDRGTISLIPKAHSLDSYLCMSISFIWLLLKQGNCWLHLFTSH